MKRLALAVAFLLAVPAWAQVFVYTNDVLSLDPLSHPLSFQSGAPMRYTVYPVQAGTPMSVSGLTGQLAVVDRADGATVATYTGAVVDATTFRFSGTVGTSQLRIGGNYQGRGSLYLNGSLVAQISDDYISVVESYCSTCSASGGGGSVTVIYTNVTIINVTNQLDNITSTIENYYTSGVSAVNGLTGALQLVVTSGGTITANGQTLELSATGAAQSPATNTIDLAGNQITNGAARLTGLQVGPDVADSGTNNVALSGRATFGAGSKGNVSAGHGITFNNAVVNSFASGSNIVVAGSMAGVVGRDLSAGANYDFVVGLGNSILSGGQMSSILGGYINTNAGALYAFIGGGTRNTIGSGAYYSGILGGASNQVDGIGGFAVGHSGYVPSTVTNALIINLGPTRHTNAVSGSVAFNVPGGIRLTGGGSYWVDGQQGVSSTTLLLRADGVSIYTQIVVRGVHIQ